MSKLLTFQQFNDIALARVISERLAEAGIEYEIESQNPHLDPLIIGNSPDSSIDLKIPAQDFIRARAVLEAYYEEQLQDVDPDYYLLNFTDQELLEILARPDEWGPFDYVLARKLLIQRGHPITKEFTDELKAKRLRDLAEFEDTGTSVTSPIGLGGMVSGYIVATKKKTLPDGSQVPAYSPNVRKRGWIFFTIGAIVLGLLLLWMLL